MTAAGRLAQPKQITAAVAHELNNVLTVLRTYTHFVRHPTTVLQAAEDLRVVAAATERASALVDWLSSQSEEAARPADELSANEFVSMASARLEKLVQPSTTIGVMRASSDRWFRAHALRLEHVVMSLVLAASQRWAQTNFAFSVEQTQVAGGARLDLEPGEYVVLVVTCTDATKESDWQAKLAPPPEQISVLIAPLAELMCTMHGKLELVRTSPVEERIELYLPAASASSRVQSAQRLAIAPPSSSTVCIIENESAIRLAMARALSTAGYFVIQADDDANARSLLIQHGPAVGLLVCDVGLLRAAGGFFEWVRANCPNAELLLVSGDAQQGEAVASSLRARFLAKPFASAELVSTTQSTIGNAEARRRGPTGQRLVVLIVDDEQVIRESLARLLDESDFGTATSGSSSHALRLMSERHFDAIVTDQFMPGLGGVELLALVKERFPACTRILCTGYPAAAVVADAARRGNLHAVLSKSMHAVALRDAIEAVISKEKP